MELDLRTKTGNHKVTFHGDLADNVFKFLATQDGIAIESRKFKGKITTCFRCVSETGVGFKNEILEAILFKDEFCVVLK
jgi:hypothetical protein